MANAEDRIGKGAPRPDGEKIRMAKFRGFNDGVSELGRMSYRAHYWLPDLPENAVGEAYLDAYAEGIAAELLGFTEGGDMSGATRVRPNLTEAQKVGLKEEKQDLTRFLRNHIERINSDPASFGIPAGTLRSRPVQSTK